MVDDDGKVEGIPMECKRCHMKFVYTGSKIEEAKTANYPVFISCSKCRSSSLRLIVPGAVYHPKVYNRRPKATVALA